MILRCVPTPFDPSSGFRIVVDDAVPPYTFEAAGSPPNPPGVTVSPTGEVAVDPAPPTGTPVIVEVTDVTGQHGVASNRVG